MKRVLLLCLLSSAAASVAAQAAGQPVPTDSLYRTIAALDSAMFEAYNQCDLARLETFFTEDLEFYHDQTGLMGSPRSLIEAVRQNICGKVHRDTEPGTLEIHPLRGYGAVATGVHRFCDARRYQHCGTAGGPARFVTLWQQTAAGWKISRVISYDHH